MTDPSRQPQSDQPPVDDEELVAAAEERIDDVEAEFGPQAPPRGVLPNHPETLDPPDA
jgi:hypothetical protein